MTDDLAALAGFEGQVRLFPLPNLVLFPHVVQGLHIFEPRYRQLMADSLLADGTIAIALLESGWEDDYDGRPPIEPVACLGRIAWHEKLPDGRYNLRLRGLSRVRLIEEVATDRLYRVARAELIPDVVAADLPRLKRMRKALAEAVLPHFAEDANARRQVEDLFGGDLPLGHICDILAYGLPLPLEFKQGLLSEPHVDLRAERMTDALKVSAARATRRFPPDFSSN
jgi:Lon protease-like protein